MHKTITLPELQKRGVLVPSVLAVSCSSLDGVAADLFRPWICSGRGFVPAETNLLADLFRHTVHCGFVPGGFYFCYGATPTEKTPNTCMNLTTLVGTPSRDFSPLLTMAVMTRIDTKTVNNAM